MDAFNRFWQWADKPLESGKGRHRRDPAEDGSAGLLGHDATPRPAPVGGNVVWGALCLFFGPVARSTTARTTGCDLREGPRANRTREIRELRSEFAGLRTRGRSGRAPRGGCGRRRPRGPAGDRLGPARPWLAAPPGRRRRRPGGGARRQPSQAGWRWLRTRSPARPGAARPRPATGNRRPRKTGSSRRVRRRAPWLGPRARCPCCP
jgi:hypothetical protein